MGQQISFPSNGASADGYLASPEEGAGPGIVVIQEYWGLVPHIIDVCDRFAAEGFTALAPDLYHGDAASEPEEARKLMTTMDLDQAARDLRGAVAALEESDVVRGQGVGVVGFCMGGGLALTLACHDAGVRACVSFYGLAPPGAEPDWSQLAGPVELHIAEGDRTNTPEAAHQLRDQLKDLGKSVEVHVYAGTQHAFFNDTRPDVYDADAARLAWERTLDFFRSHLG